MKLINKLIKRLLTILILIFTLQTPPQADDIRDFEIEGMSIGDSLLDYYTESEILNNKQGTQYPNDEFIIYILSSIKDLNTYERFTITIKKNDKNYIIAGATGAIEYSRLEECFKMKKDLDKQISSLFSKVKKEEVKYKPEYDKSGESMAYGIEYHFPSGDYLVVNCNDWSKKVLLSKVFIVSMRSKKFQYFLAHDSNK